VWTDGLHTHILRKMIVDNVRSELFKRHWIIFDGDVEPENSFGAENTGSRTQQPQQPLDDSDDAAAASSSADLTASPARATRRRQGRRRAGGATKEDASGALVKKLAFGFEHIMDANRIRLLGTPFAMINKSIRNVLDFHPSPHPAGHGLSRTRDLGTRGQPTSTSSQGMVLAPVVPGKWLVLF